MDDAKLLEVLPDELRELIKDIEMYGGDDALLPWLKCISWIKCSLPASGLTAIYQNLLDFCIKKFSKESRYFSDMRFLQIWIQYADCYLDAEKVFKQMEALHIGQDSALFYGAYAICLEAQGKFLMANNMYHLGFSRQAKPVSMLDKGYKEFLKRVASRHRHRLMKESKPNASSNVPDDGKSLVTRQNLRPIPDISLQLPQVVQMPHVLMDLSTNCPRDSVAAMSLENKKKRGLSSPCYEVKKSNGKSLLALKKFNPWENETIEKLLRSLKPPLRQYQGFHCSNQKHKGASLMSLKSAPHNKVLELGSRRYHLKGCTGQGAFAQVFKACEEQDRDNIVVLKIQRPPCPWEFYIYSQLDKRIPQEERASFGHAWEMHTYEDCSIMVCAYGERGTLQDVVNSYLAIGEKMDELLCMYYTVEMLRMLEVLHSVEIIHGDFKPDNFLIRNEGELLEDWAPDRPGHWQNQGLCLIDWGRSIDLKLFPPGTEFDADCKTSGFCCIEMQNQKPWTYQIDTYGLCCIVHIMLHGSYMEIESKSNSQNVPISRPKMNLKRYHKAQLWGELFTTLLNVKSCQENPSLAKLRGLFESYLTSNPQFSKKIKELIVRQSKIMCSRN